MNNTKIDWAKAQYAFATVAYSFTVPEFTRHMKVLGDGGSLDALVRSEFSIAERKIGNGPKAMRKSLERHFKGVGYQVIPGSNVYLIPMKKIPEAEEMIEASRDAYQQWYEQVKFQLPGALKEHLKHNPQLAKLLASQGIKLSPKAILSGCGFHSSTMNGSIRPQLLGMETDAEYAEYASQQALERARQVREGVLNKVKALLGNGSTVTPAKATAIYEVVGELSAGGIFSSELGEMAKAAKRTLEAQLEASGSSKVSVAQFSGLLGLLGGQAEATAKAIANAV